MLGWVGGWIARERTCRIHDGPKAFNDRPDPLANLSCGLDPAFDLFPQFRGSVYKFPKNLFVCGTNQSVFLNVMGKPLGLFDIIDSLLQAAIRDLHVLLTFVQPGHCA